MISFSCLLRQSKLLHILTAHAQVARLEGSIYGKFRILIGLYANGY